MSRQSWFELAMVLASAVAGWWARHFGVDVTGLILPPKEK